MGDVDVGVDLIIVAETEALRIIEETLTRILPSAKHSLTPC